ncbi:hypothetical protein FB563_2244 [Streptomyces puniciscabiei]|uniref:Extracellular solute-binding protein n=1 Tax=Streptomyces puniciscabiei TaxID=164348 RepID=A0A542UDZ7_9ACTN|nr:hypothetical protein [Streptomyces puniciscabiei]TQK97281.1 hypothetical protein FB563_2244 [Streptomyces puniciscabiei]
MVTHRAETERPPQTGEPRLRVGEPADPPSPGSTARRWFPRAVAAVTALCAVVVLAQGHVGLPFTRIVTIEAKMASKADYFEDPEVQRLLVRHGFRVHITRMGSRGIAAQSYDGYDVVFPSGQPAADLITRKRAAEGHPATTYRPFVSPVVLGTYREYAETLHDAGIATPLPGVPAGSKPLYYSLNMQKFLQATADGRRWDSLGTDRSGRRIGIDSHGIHNGNKVLAQTSDICEANSAGTYLGLVSYIWNHDNIPQDTAEATRFAERIRLLLNDQGMPSSEKNETYVSAEGKSIAPIAVIYEHQFLAHQIATQAGTGHVDSERVLLYPSARFIAEPQLIALTPAGDRLGDLITRDPALQKRAMELGFRVRDAEGASATSDSLTRFLTDHHIQAPVLSDDDTKAVLPRLDLLEKMIEIVGDCDPVAQSATGGDAP